MSPEALSPEALSREAPNRVAEESFDELVPGALDGQRIDRTVAIVADVSRREAAEAVASGQVFVDGRPVHKASQRVIVGQAIRFVVERAEERLEADPDLEIPLIHVDEQLIVVDKPAGLVVHPGSGVSVATMVNGLLSRFPELRTVGEGARPGIVHRLDRGTSGLLVVARTDHAYEHLVRQLRDRTVERRYRGLASGHLQAESGLIDAPLGRSPHNPTRRAVTSDGLVARTHYEVLERLTSSSDPYTLLTCRLETGRTHQIRVHLAAIGHPVAGDRDYGGTAVVAGDAELARPFLHAEHLAFAHPATGQRVQFSSALASDLVAVLAGLAPVLNGDGE